MGFEESMIRFDRREFMAGAAAFVAAGCSTSALSRNFEANGEMKAVLLHLGHNMWCDWFPSEMEQALADLRREYDPKRSPLPDVELRNDTGLWRDATGHAAARGLNTVVVDIGEGLVYPSHPELAIKGSWTPDEMHSEIARLNALGLEVVPKLNFSTTHNGWLKQYRRMLSTPTYYRVCEDLIADVAEVFGHPRLFHIGFDEETAAHQDSSGRALFITVRKGECWWHDFLHIVKISERHGMRPWMWSDYGWDHPEFYTRCPKSVLMSNWYYDESYGGFDLAANKTDDHKRLKAFYDLDKAGFDQVPCGTNWAGWKRRLEKVGADDVMGRLVKLGRDAISDRHLKGFMMASWASCDTREHLDFITRGIDLLAAAT